MHVWWSFLSKGDRCGGKTMNAQEAEFSTLKSLQFTQTIHTPPMESAALQSQTLLFHPHTAHQKRHLPSRSLFKCWGRLTHFSHSAAQRPLSASCLSFSTSEIFTQSLTFSTYVPLWRGKITLTFTLLFGRQIFTK
jgi:hypothetical protein